MVVVSSGKTEAASAAGIPASGALNVGFQAAFMGAAAIAVAAALVAARAIRAPREAEKPETARARAA